MSPIRSAAHRHRIESILRTRVSSLIGASLGQLGERDTFSSLGIDSNQIARLSREVGEALGQLIPPTAFYEHASISQLAAHLAGQAAVASDSPSDGEVERDDPIAIVGMACRFPHAASLEEYWRVLVTGEDCTSEIPPARWDAAALHDPTGRGPKSSITRRAALIDGVDLFEPEFFGLSPREAASVDPQQRLMLELAWEALEHAGQVPGRLRGRRVGVFVGGMSTDYGELTWTASNSINANYGTGSALTLLSNRISYLFGFRGPSLTIDTACASSLTALHLACQSLRRGEAELAVAGGVILHLRPNGFATMSRLGALSPDGRSKAFGASADGYGRGEGGGLVLLKRLADARRDRDVIHCIVRGSAINHNGQSNGLTAPSPQAQAELLREAWARAGADPAEATYVEAHGTGTALGDPLEAEALGRVFGAARSDQDPLFIGSAKSNIGHTEAAAGVAGLIKVALAMRHRMIPPSLHAEVPNPLIRFDDWRMRVPTSVAPWPAGRRLAGVSAFGFGGANAHVVIESVTPEPAHVLALAAADATVLDKVVGDHIAGAASGAVREVDGRERVAVIARTPRHAASALSAFRAGERHSNVIRNGITTGRSAFVFAGIGSVWAGMGDHPVVRRRAFREVIARCDPITRRLMGVSVAWELHRGPTSERLANPLLHGLLAVVMGMALDAAWRDMGVTPDTVVGHSIGEFAAAVAAGALTVEEGTELTCTFLRWNRRLVEADTTMAVIGLGGEPAREALAGFEDEVGVCVDNAPDQVVIGGGVRALTEVCANLTARGIQVRPLGMPIAPHSPVARRLADGLSRALGPITPRPMCLPWVSTVTAAPVASTELDGGYWERNLGELNRFREAVEELARRGCDVFVLVGAHPVVRANIIATLAAMGASGQVLSTFSRDSVDERELQETMATLWTRGRAKAPDVPPAPAHAPLEGRALALPVSAAVPSSLAEMVAAWRARLATLESDALDLACGAAGARRAHHRHRLAVIGRDARALSDKLAGAQPFAAPASPAPVVFVFSGQGATFTKVGRSLYAEEPAFRQPIDRCDAVVRSLAGWSLVDALLDDQDEERTRQTGVVQPLIFAIQIGLAEFWRSVGITPAAVVGQSVGEIAAAFAAGALTIEEATRIVLLRGMLMEQAACGGRTAELTLALADAEHLLAGRDAVSVAGINGPSTTLIAGDADAVAGAVRAAEAAGISCRMLRMEYAFHSHHMDALLPRFSDALGEVRSAAPTTDLWSTVTGSLVGGAPLDATYWCANVRAPVRLGTVIEKLLAAGHTTLLEVSPHPVLREPLRDCLRAWAPTGTVLHSLRRDRDDREQVLETIAALYGLGHEIDWAAVQGRGDPTLAPGYRWDRRRFWFEANRLGVAHAGGALLGHRVDSGTHPGTTYWESVVSAESPGWLGDHRVRGRALMPGAAFAEMAITVGEHVLRVPVEVRELCFLRALALDEPRLMQVCLVQDGDGARVMFFSRAASVPSEPLVIHATTRVVPSAADGSDESPSNNVGDASGERLGDASSLYERLASIGLTYGPLFQGVIGLREGKGGAVGDVELPESLSASSAALHPALLDACLHVAASVLLADGELWLPVSIERLRVRVPGARSLLVHAFTEVLGADRIASVRGFTRDGRAALEIDGLRVRRPTAPRELPALEEWLHEERWPPTPLPASAGTRIEGTWIVLGAAGDSMSRALSRAIEVRGGTAIRVSREPTAAEPPLQGARGVVATTTLDAPNKPLETAIVDVIDAAASAARFAAAINAPLVVLTHGARGVDGEAAASLASAAACGVARALAMEDPALLAGIIDLDPEIPIVEQVTVVVDELAAGLPDDQVVHRHGQRRAGRLVQSREVTGQPIRCFAQSTYLVTGGLGALGLVAARWLADRGARRIVLVGRTGLPPRSTWSMLELASSSAIRVQAVLALEARGVTVRVETLDVGDRAAFADVLDRLAQELPPIRGVVHAAGVLRDQTLANLDRASAAMVVAPKVAGALALHEALGSALDFFLLYSSAAGTLGSAGQAAYAAANLVLDEFARMRRARGQVATSLAWGAWADVGMAADPRILERMAAIGFGAISPADGVRILDLVASGTAPHVGVFPVRWPLFRVARESVARRAFFSMLGREQDTEPACTVSQDESPVLDIADPASREIKVAAWLVSCVVRLLGIPAERLRRDMSLQSLGLDSLVAVELRNAIQTDVGVKVQVAALSESTVDSLAQHISALFGSGSPAKQTATTGSGWSPLVKLVEGSTRPLICVHPVGGNVLCYLPLAAALGGEQPLWALQAPTGGEAPPDRTITAMAKRYLDAVRAAGAGDPWLFCGFSFGGAVAYEMALQAVDAGERVTRVVLIDTRVQRQSLLPDEETLLEWCLKDLTGGHGAALANGVTPAARVLGGARRAGLFGPEITEAALAPLIEVFRASVSAMVEWQPARGRFPVTLLRALDTPLENVEPWRRACGVEMDEIPVMGDHYNLLRPPYVSAIAARVQACISDSDEPTTRLEDQR